MFTRGTVRYCATRGLAWVFYESSLLLRHWEAPEHNMLDVYNIGYSLSEIWKIGVLKSE